MLKAEVLLVRPLLEAVAREVTALLQVSWPSVTLSPSPPIPQSIIRVVFHDRRLQYTEHQQLEGWKWNRPGDRLLDLGMSGCRRLWRGDARRLAVVPVAMLAPCAIASREFGCYWVLCALSCSAVRNTVGVLVLKGPEPGILSFQPFTEFSIGASISR